MQITYECVMCAGCTLLPLVDSTEGAVLHIMCVSTTMASMFRRYCVIRAAHSSPNDVSAM